MFFSLSIRDIIFIFQLVDDALDFTSTTYELGKPVAADLSLGLATAPVLYAAETVSLYEIFIHG